MSLTSSDIHPAAPRPATRLRTTLAANGVWSAAIVVLLIAGGAVLAYQTRATTFWADEWTWILTRRQGGLGTFLDAHNSHFSLVPVLIYKALFATAGLRHYWPYRGVLIALQLLVVLLVFIYARRRVGGYAALLAAALILFFGPGWQDILWPFQMAWLIAVATGVGALQALDRRDRVGDLAACALLVISVASAGPGLAMLAGGLVEVLLRRRRRDLWIPGVPIVIYAIWSIGYQSTAIDAHSITRLPQFVFHAAAGVMSSLVGLAGVNVYSDSGTYTNWGAPLLILGLLAAALWLVHLGRIPRRVVSLTAIVLGFWVLTGIGRAYAQLGSIVVTSTGDESRYLYVGAVFVVLLAVELLRGHTPGLWTGLVLGVLAVAAIVSNLGTMRDGSAFLRSTAQLTEGELATLNLDRHLVRPGFVSGGFLFGILSAGPWFSAEHDLGYQAAVPGPISALGPTARQAADQQLVKIQGLALTPTANGAPAANAAPALVSLTSGTRTATGACVRFRPSAFTPAGVRSALAVTVPPSGLVFSDGAAAATVAVRRFGTGFNTLGKLAPGVRARLTPRRDGSPTPWQALLTATEPVSVCAA